MATDEAMAVLRVDPAPSGEGLQVDAGALVQTKNDVRYWLLLSEGDGIWHHAGSGESGPLSEMLRAIALAYVVVPDPVRDATIALQAMRDEAARMDVGPS